MFFSKKGRMNKKKYDISRLSPIFVLKVNSVYFFDHTFNFKEKKRVQLFLKYHVSLTIYNPNLLLYGCVLYWFLGVNININEE